MSPYFESRVPKDGYRPESSKHGAIRHQCDLANQFASEMFDGFRYLASFVWIIHMSCLS